jgi:hypothetical protein
MEMHQSPDCDRDLPSPGADQISPPRTTVPSTVKPLPVSYANATKTGLAVTKKQTRASWGSTRANKEERVWQQEEDTLDVCFARPMLGHVLAVPYDKKTCLVDQVVKAILTTFPDVTLVDHYLPGVVYVQFETEKERDQALEMVIPFSPLPLPTKPIVFSTGNRVKIRVEHMVAAGPDDRTKLIEETFGAYGKVVHTTYHYWKGSRRALMPSFEFVLEVPETASKDLEIPRVASLLGTNHLFTWGGSPFCYRCGQGNHTKQNCPKPADFNLTLSPPVALPLMARAFPDTAIHIPSSLPSSPATRPPPAKPSRAEHTATSTTTPAPTQEQNWNTVRRWNKRKASGQSTTSTQRSKQTDNKTSSPAATFSASDSEPEVRPTKKPTPTPRSEEAVTNPAPTPSAPPPTPTSVTPETPAAPTTPATGADTQEAPTTSTVTETQAPEASSPTVTETQAPEANSPTVTDLALPQVETPTQDPPQESTPTSNVTVTQDATEDAIEMLSEDEHYEDAIMEEDTIQSSQEFFSQQEDQVMADRIKETKERRATLIRAAQLAAFSTPPSALVPQLEKKGGGVKKKSSPKTRKPKQV